MVSQFVSPHTVKLLGDLDFNFPEGTHAIGRLDINSEGLLLLTTDKTITRRLFLAPVAHKRTYLVQINNILSKENLLQLQLGTNIKVNNNEWYTTPPCDVQIVDDVKTIYQFAENANVYGPHTWLLITLTEGKYHQVRKMVGSIKHRCKRLIRVSIEDLQLGNLPPGEVKELNEKEFCTLLHI